MTPIDPSAGSERNGNSASAGGSLKSVGSALLFTEGDGTVIVAPLCRSNIQQLWVGIEDLAGFTGRDAKLRDARDFANRDPRPKADSPAPPEEGEDYTGAFGRPENWLEEWTVFLTQAGLGTGVDCAGGTPADPRPSVACQPSPPGVRGTPRAQRSRRNRPGLVPLPEGILIAAAFAVLTAPASAQTPSTGLTLTLSQTEFDEDAAATSVTVTAGLNGSALTAATSVSVSVTGGTATSGADYAAVSAFTVTIAAGDTSGMATLSFDPTEDALSEGDETVVLTATATALEAATATLTIKDNEPATQELSAVFDAGLFEGESTPISATIPFAVSEDVIVTVSITAGAGYEEHFDLTDPPTLTIAAGSTTSTGQVTFTAVDDYIRSSGKPFSVTLTPDHARVGAVTRFLLVRDDDFAATLLQVFPNRIFENGGTATLRAAMIQTKRETATLEVSLSPSGVATLSGTTFTFPPGALYASKDLTITAVDNGTAGADATLSISAAVTGGRGLTAPGAITLTIADEDGTAPTEVALRMTPERVREGLVSIVTAESSRTLSEDLTITVSASPGHAATLASDFQLSANTELTIPAGSSKSTGVVTIATVDDQIYEATRRRAVTVSGTVPADSSIAAPNDRTLTILEDDESIAVALVATPPTILEAGGVSTITMRALKPVPSAVTATVSIGSGQGAELSSNTALTIAAGQTESTGTVTLTAIHDTDKSNEVVNVFGTAAQRFVNTRHVRAYIIDDDFDDPTVTVATSPPLVYEGEVGRVSAYLSEPLTDDVTVTVGIDADDPDHVARADEYTVSANRILTIPAGGTTSSDAVVFTAADDHFFGPRYGHPDVLRRVVLVLESVTGVDRSDLKRHSDWHILDDEAYPVATLRLTPRTVSEGGVTSTVTAHLNTRLRSAAEVTITSEPVGAASASDYTQTGTTLTIPAGEKDSSGTVTITSVDDNIFGPDKHVVLSGSVVLSDPAIDEPVWFPHEEVLTITDNDTAPTAVTLSLDPDSVSEGAAATDITVTASLVGSALSQATTVSVTQTGGTATSGTDYPAISDFTVTIPAGQTSGTHTLSFDPTDDSVFEGSETVILTATATGLTAGTATLTITDNDTAPTAISLSLDPDSVSEGAASTDITVTASLVGSALPQATAVSVARTGGTATSGTDYPAISDFTVTIPAGQTSGTHTLSFAPTDDSVSEGSETVILTATATGLAAGTATLTITDNDAAPTAISLSLNPTSVSEGAAATDITVTASLVGSALPEATTVSVTRTGGTATSGTDYAAISDFTVTIPAGQTSGTHTLSFAPTDDSVSEGSETVILTATATGLTAGTATLTITDNDTAPTAISLSLNPASVSEGAAATDITVTASLVGWALPQATIVSVSRTGGTATSGTDYAAISDFTVTIPANQASGTHTLSFAPADDSVFEGSETVILSGSTAGLDGADATLTITDNDTAPTAISLSLDPGVVSEGAATDITVTASLVGSALLQATTVSVTRTGGTASSGTDYPAISGFTVTIPAGQTSGTHTLSFAPADDPVSEGGETVILTATATGLTGGAATLTITDNDTAPTAISLSLDPDSVSEGAAATDITVTASLVGSALPQATTVSVAQTGGTASSGTDYPAISGFTVTIPAGQTSGTHTLSFAPADDSVSEGSETVILTATATGLTAGAATLTITDNDAAPTAISLSLDPASVSEGAAATSVTVTASLDGRASSETAVSVSVTGGTATAGEDYAAISGFTVIIPAEQTSGTATLSFEPIEDTRREKAETLVLSGTATGLTAGTATLTVTDNDRSKSAGDIRPPAITIWTDRLSYGIEEQPRLHLDIDPQRDEREYTLFVFLEKIDTGRRLYLARIARSVTLRDEVVDLHGRGSEAWKPRPLERVEKQLLWEGPVPGPGLWHFVAELRSPGTTQVLQRAYAKFVVPSAGPTLLSRRGFERVVETDLRLTNDRVYFLGGRVLVKAGTTLAIEAGTLVKAFGPGAEIVIEPGARILALGRREAPIVFTCSLPPGERPPGCWGGLKLFGRAAVADGREAAAEFRQDPAFDHSEADPHDSSGELRFLRVEFAGAASVPEVPSGAIEFHGVGDGTVIDHVQAHASLGGGFAFRGGTAHCNYCVSSEARGDSLAWDRGWQGSVQHLYVQQGPEAASAIRGSAARPAIGDGMPTLYNATLVGGYNISVPGGAPGNLRSIGPGIVLDGEAAVKARNVLAIGFAGYALDGSVSSFASGHSSFSHAVLAKSGYRYGSSSQLRHKFAPYASFSKADPRLLNVRYGANPDPRPRSGSAALQLHNAAVPPFDPRFSRAAHYVGAFRRKNWLEEWTIFGPEKEYGVARD